MQYLGRLKERLFAFRADTDDVAAAARVFSATLRQTRRAARSSTLPRRPVAAMLLAVVQSVAAAAEDLRLDSPDRAKAAVAFASVRAARRGARAANAAHGVASGRTMCLAVIALDAHPRYALVIAANRDEFHARAADAPHWWKDERDMRSSPGATSRGRHVARRHAPGRWAFVTNVREPGRTIPQAPSRGALVPRVCATRRDAAAAVAANRGNGACATTASTCSPASARRATWASNRGDGIASAAGRRARPVERRARHAVAEGRARESRRRRLGGERQRRPRRRSSALLADRARRPTRMLPATGVSLEWERLLSSPFIVSDDYGTRCSTVLARSRDGAAHLSSAASTRQVKSPATSIRASAARPCSRQPADDGALRAGRRIGTSRQGRCAPSPGAECPPPRIRRRWRRSRAARRTASPAICALSDHPRVAARSRASSIRRSSSAAPTPCPRQSRTHGHAADVTVGEAGARSRSAHPRRPSRARASHSASCRPIRALPARAARRRTRRANPRATPAAPIRPRADRGR